MHYKAAWACGQAALRLAHMPTRRYDHHRLSPLVSTRNDEGPLHATRLKLVADSIKVSLQDITTHSVDVGESLRQVATPKGGERNLTAGEVAMARSVFGDGLDYDAVKVHRGGYWLFFGFQDEDTAVTPNGEMYFPGKHFKEGRIQK